MAKETQDKSSFQSMGFTLVELVIVLVIAGVVFASIAGGLKVYFQKIRFDRTQENQQQVQTALIRYMQENGSLPCPAPLTKDQSDSDFGRSDDCSAGTNGTFQVAGRAGLDVRIGAFPARDLNLPDNVMLDGWGHMFTYAVTERLTQNMAFSVPNADLIIDVSPVSPMSLRDAELTGFDLRLGGNFRSDIGLYRDRDNLMLITNTNTEDLSDDGVLMIRGYFSGGAPDLVVTEDVSDSDFLMVYDESTTGVTPDDIDQNLQDILLFTSYNRSGIQVLSESGDPLSPPNPSNGAIDPGHIPYVVISHGPTGRGGYTISGVKSGTCDGTETEEDSENCDFDDANFVAAVQGLSLAEGTDFNDDMVLYSANMNGMTLWPPSETCEADGDISNGDDGFRVQLPSGGWTDCLDLRGPRGEQGERGPRGLPGPAGPPSSGPPSGGGPTSAPPAVPVATGSCAAGFFVQGFRPDGSLICGEGVGVAGLDSVCTRKRSATYNNDFVTWCDTAYPNLYSCAQVDDEAPNTPFNLGSDCPNDGECLMNGSGGTARRRGELGGNGIYYERVFKSTPVSSGGSVNVEGCVMYDSAHTHRPHRADIMCCR